MSLVAFGLVLVVLGVLAFFLAAPAVLTAFLVVAGVVFAILGALGRAARGGFY